MKKLAPDLSKIQRNGTMVEGIGVIEVEVKSPIEQARELLNSYRCNIGEFADALLKLTCYAESLEREIKILREWGNKDCTAMADEELERIRENR